MNLKATDYPALAADLVSHTVRDPQARGVLHAGYLVRCTATHRELGFVWPMGEGATFGKAWGWVTPDASGYGERVNRRAAVQALRDVATATTWRAPMVVIEHEDVVERARQQSPRPRPEPKPEPEPKRIVWPETPVNLNVGDLTDKIREALKRQQS